MALREAEKLKIPTIGVLDTDSDPDTVDVAIPANDDSIRAIEIILNELADAVAIGKTMVSGSPAGDDAPAAATGPFPSAHHGPRRRHRCRRSQR